ncbi:MAG: hypothetical protein JKY23_06610, partial [Nitrospinaceae bacterium]|nr:hypothetical protein [Nitrospinaceae bacterium]
IAGMVLLSLVLGLAIISSSEATETEALTPPAAKAPAFQFIPRGCVPTIAGADNLKRLHGEVLVAVGSMNGGGFMYLFASKDGLTWTITTVNKARSYICPKAGGEFWLRSSFPTKSLPKTPNPKLHR